MKPDEKKPPNELFNRSKQTSLNKQDGLSFIFVVRGDKPAQLGLCEASIKRIATPVPIEFVTHVSDKWIYKTLNKIIPTCKYNTLVFAADDLVFTENWYEEIYPWFQRYDIVGSTVVDRTGAIHHKHNGTKRLFQRYNAIRINGDPGVSMQGMILHYDTWRDVKFDETIPFGDVNDPDWINQPGKDYAVHGDLEFTRRAQRCGYSQAICPSAIVLHLFP